METKTEFPEGSTLGLRFVLFGKAIAYFPYFLVTVREMGRLGISRSRGRFEVTSVTDGLIRKELFDGRSQTVLHAPHEQPGTEIAATGRSLLADCGGAVVTFLTPARMKYDRHYREQPEFHILVRNLLRRASTLAYFYHDHPLDLDFKGLIEAARGVRLTADHTYWDDWERFSNRQGRAMKFGGVVGEVLYSGLGDGQTPDELAELLWLGRYMHVGKGTTFGLGKYEVAGWAGTAARLERPATQSGPCVGN